MYKEQVVAKDGLSSFGNTPWHRYRTEPRAMRVAPLAYHVSSGNWQEFRLSKESFSSSYNAMVMAKTHPLKDTLNLFMCRYATTGMHEFHSRRYLKFQIEMVEHYLKSKANEKVLKPIKFSQTYTQFLVLASGLGMALISFFMELKIGRRLMKLNI